MFKNYRMYSLIRNIVMLIPKFIAIFYIGFSMADEVKVADNLKANLLAPSPMSNSVWQMALGLVFVLVIIFLLAWLMRRVTGIQGSRGHIKILSAINVGTRERAVLVEVAGEQLLLGVAAGQVNLLHKIANPIAASNAVPVTSETMEKNSVSFSSSLQKAVKKLKQNSEKSTN